MTAAPTTGTREITCEVLRDGCFDGLDIVIVDVDDPIALEWAPVAAAAGARVVDNSAAFRGEADIPLVVAEVNPGDLDALPRNIASCPNCTTMVLLTALAPLHRAAGIDRMVVSTYQAVSGAGQAGMDELDEQWLARATDLAPLRRAAAVDGTITPGKVWGSPIAGNAIPLAGSVREAGYTSEEWKLVRETHKILHDDAIRVTATCVRVPVYVGHSMTANVQFRSAMDAARAAAGRPLAERMEAVSRPLLGLPYLKDAAGEGAVDVVGGSAQAGGDRPGSRRAGRGGSAAASTDRRAATGRHR